MMKLPKDLTKVLQPYLDSGWTMLEGRKHYKIKSSTGAFASAGNVTNKYMNCKRLITPAIKKSEIKEIILGGGQNLLSPERRFDAILFNSPGLFS